MAHQDDDYPVSGFVTDPPRSSSYGEGLDEPTDADEVLGPDWSEFAQVVQETASYLLDEILEEPKTGPLELGFELEDEVDATAVPLPPPPPPGPAIPQRAALTAGDTVEIEIFREQTDPDRDVFETTGIGIVNVETGDILTTAELGVHGGKLNFVLDEEELPLKGLWAAYLAELKAEIMAESDIGLRAAYVYVFANIIRALNGSSLMNRALGGLSDEMGGVLRSSLLERLASLWDDPNSHFFELLERLERLDTQGEGNLATLRRSSIALERLLDPGLGEEEKVRLRALMIPPETLPALVVQAVEAHWVKDLSRALHAWRRLGKHANGELRRGATILVPYLLSGHTEFFQVVESMLEEGISTRGMLTFLQRESFQQGNWVSEARALKRLVAQDGKIGRKIENESAQSRKRLLRESSARLFRLATILRRLARTQVKSGDDEFEGIDAYKVLRDAVSLHATNLVTLRRLERWAREKGDRAMVEQALISQVPLVDDARVSAMLWEKLAALSSENEADVSIVADYLQKSLEEDPACLPALISLGQEIIRHGAFADMLQLQGVPEGEESRTAKSAWRRAEILERAQGDLREILTLYRSAQDDDPESVHLYFCVERSLARLADWRGLRGHVQSVSSDSPTYQSLPITRLAVEAFLEDPSDEFVGFWKRHIETYPKDEGAIWRVVANAIEEGEVASILRMVEELELGLRATKGPERARVLIWMAYIAEYHTKDEGLAIEAYRELFQRPGGVFQKRFAVQGLLRNRDFAWLGERVLESQSLEGWALPEVDDVRHESYRVLVAAELLALGGQYKRSLDVFKHALALSSDERIRAEISERAFHHSLRSRRWAEGFRFAGECFENESARAVGEFTRHLASCLDEPGEVLAHLDDVEANSNSSVILLDEIELAYRARDSKRLSRLLERALGTAEAGSIDFRAFLLEQAVLVGAWGWDSPELTIACLDDLWSLDAALTTSPFFAVGAYLRSYTRLGREDKIAEWTDYANSNFTPQVAQALLAESNVYDEAKGGLQAHKWYKERIPKVPAPLQPYYRWMSAFLGWYFQAPRPDLAYELVGASEEGDPTHRVGAFVGALAIRESDPTEFVTQLRGLKRAGNPRPLQQWSTIRTLFHTATTLNAPDKALDMLAQDDVYAVFEWSELAQEVFGRSLRRTAAIEQLRDRAKSARGQRILQLELSQIVGDSGMFPRLAAQGVPAAQVLVEVQAAQGERVHAPGLEVSTRYLNLATAIREESAEQVRRLLMAYLLEVDEVFWGSPWCPIRLVNADLTRFGLSVEDLQSLHRRVVDFAHKGVASEARLMIARQFQRMGQRALAHELMPEEMHMDAVSMAWALFNHALDPFAQWPKSARWAQALWAFRQQSSSAIEAECLYERGHYFEAVGALDKALECYESSLGARPSFLPAQIATARELIRRGDWARLAKTLEHQHQNAKYPDQRSSLAFRLGYVWDRRLRGEPEADAIAESWYLDVTRTRPAHVPSYEALLSIAFRQFNYEAASQYLSRLVELTQSVQVKVAYLVELGTIYEHHLNDVPGALEVYRAAFELDNEQALAFFGILRTDKSGDVAVRAIELRLGLASSSRERADLAHHLFAFSRQNPRVHKLLQTQFPTHYGLRLATIVNGLENSEVDEGTLSGLENTWDDPETKILTMAVRRLTKPTQLVGEALHTASQLGTDPFSEGRLLRAMHFAWKHQDLEALGVLATTRARRATSPVLRSAELTWMVATHYLRGDKRAALQIVEKLLTQYLDFLPSVKMARLFAEELKEWESVVRWNQRDAELSRVKAIVDANRLRASEVQKTYLKDTDAAVETLRGVLKTTPRHKDAFKKLSEILWQRREFHELLSVFEHQVHHAQGDEESCELLNRMAEISLQELGDRRGAIGYLTRSLQKRPGQKRRTKQIAELYEQEGLFEKAVSCWSAAVGMSQEQQEVHQIWSQIGYLIEVELKRPADAKSAWSKALEVSVKDVNAMMALARVCEVRHEYREALDYLTKALEISRDSNVQKTARVGLYRVSTKANQTLDEILSVGATLIFHHPESLETVDDIRSRLVAAGRGEELSDIFRVLAIEAIAKRQPRAHAAHARIAKKMGFQDRAFRLSSLAELFGESDDELRAFYQSELQERQWPKRPIPPELSSGVIHKELVAPVLELLRLSREGLQEAIEAPAAQEFIKRANRIKEPQGEILRLAFMWPQIYGLELRDAYWATRAIPGGVDIVYDQGVRLILDPRWKQDRDPTEMLVRLGRQLASLSMGIYPWGLLGRAEEVGAFYAVVSRFVSGWGIHQQALPAGFSVPRLSRWIQRKGQRVAPYALEISGRFGAQAIERQIEVLHLSLDRLATIPLDDPGAAIRHTGLLESKIGDPAHLFLLNAQVERLRLSLGVNHGLVE